jgi:hypothetical protein
MPGSENNHHYKSFFEGMLKLIQVIFLPAVFWLYMQMYTLTATQIQLTSDVKHITMLVTELRETTVKKEVQTIIDARQDYEIKAIERAGKQQEKTNAFNKGE